MTAPACHRCGSVRALMAADGACYDARACERRRVRRVVEEVADEWRMVAWAERPEAHPGDSADRGILRDRKRAEAEARVDVLDEVTRRIGGRRA